MRFSLDLASTEARKYYASNILSTVEDMTEQGVYLDYGVMAFGAPNWRAARVAYSADYITYEQMISRGLKSWVRFICHSHPHKPTCA